MKLTTSFLVFCLCLWQASCFTTRYDGYQLLELTLTTPIQSQRLRHAELKDNLDVVWLAGGKAHVMVSPEDNVIFNGLLRDYGIRSTVVQQDVQKHIDEIMEGIVRRRDESGTFDYDYNDYNDFDTVMEELEQLAADCPDYGLTCEVTDIGMSYEGRTLKQLRIGSGDRQAYWLDATIHAREWLATTTLMRITDTLVRSYDTNADAQRLVDTYDWYILPVMNPDGYSYTWSDDRMWRKSRSPNQGSPCMGTDLNRNYDYLWGEAGASDQPCAETYHGASPASEVETVAIQVEANRLGGQLECLVSYHTYGNMFLHSWGDSSGPNQCVIAEDHDELFAVATAATDAIEATHGSSWDPGNWCEVLYPSTGTTIDYTKAVSGVKYTYTPELRGNTFAPPPSEIVPAYEEMWNGLVAMVEEIESMEK